MTHLLVAVDKFTKWIEARPIKKLDGPTAVRFIKDIALRYGMPNSIITDNGTNFAKGALEQYCSVSGIRLDLASVAHPQSNGLNWLKLKSVCMGACLGPMQEMGMNFKHQRIVHCRQNIEMLGF